MNSKNIISSSIIFKRSSCVNAVSEASDADKRIEHLNIQLESLSLKGGINTSIKSTLKSFIESLCDHDNANKYYRDCIYYIEAFNTIDKNISDYILTEYTNRILPYVEDLSMMEETVSRYELEDYQRNKILEYADYYNTADRILANHKRLSERFDVSKEFLKNKSKGLSYMVESCYSMIDTFNIPDYAKMNLCIEEMSYLLDRNNISYDKKDLVKSITENYLLNESSITNKNMTGMKKVLKENCYLTEEDIESVQFVFNTNDDPKSIVGFIHAFEVTQEKTIGLLSDTIGNICANCSLLDFICNCDKIISLIWDIYKRNLFEDEQMKLSIPVYFSMMYDKIKNEEPSKEDLDRISDLLNITVNSIISSSTDSSEYFTKCAFIKDNIRSLAGAIKDLRFYIYSESNINAIRFVNNESVEPIALNEFKIFKFHNLIRAAINLDKFLKYKAKNIYTKGANKSKKIVKKIKDVLFPESVEYLYSTIGEDCRSDITVAQYEVNDDNFNEIAEYMEEICKEFNNKLICENYNSIRCYYIINPGIAELHLKESTPISKDDIDYNMLNESMEDGLETYIESFAMGNACLETLSEYSKNWKDTTLNLQIHMESIGLEEYKVALEALSFLDVTKEDISLFSESFCNYRYNTAVLESVITESEYDKEATEVGKICSTWEKVDCTLDIQVEAFQILNAILEAAPEVKKVKVGGAINKTSTTKTSKTTSDSNKDKDEKDNKKNPFSGINLNSMRLYLEGLKKKAKDMSSKEKEVSRNLDNSFRMLVKSLKAALISDRREAIIKGSVIPSFSRCIKIAIGLAGVGVVTGNPLVPLLIAIGGFATSKRLTQKERILLLDEIETELDVVEKEIAMAESKNQMKKYRTLLKYKKDLQRQYQRIRYNIRVGKDILPGSAEGVPGSRD